MDGFASGGAPLSPGGVGRALDLLGATSSALWAVLSVETSGCGFLADRRPKILFERHVFHRLTGGRFDVRDPDVSAPTAGGYGPGGAHQYLRLQAAMVLDEGAALQSASWGLGQIMGFNHAAAGFNDARTMIDAFVGSEDAQLDGMAAFIAGSSMKRALANQDFTTFARLYNGPDFAKNNYDGKLRLFCATYNVHGAPDLLVRMAQVKLSYAGFDPGGVDGALGPLTRKALSAFQTAHGLPATGQADTATVTALEAV